MRGHCCDPPGVTASRRCRYVVETSQRLTAHSEQQFGYGLQGFGLGGATDDGGGARSLPRLQQLGDALLGAAEGNLIHERVGNGSGGGFLLAVEVEVLDLLGSGFVAVAAGEVIVEVLAPSAHAADVER